MRDTASLFYVSIVAASLGAASTAHAQMADDEEEVVREARPSKSVENVLREEHTLFSDRLTIEPGINYSYSDRSQLALRGFLALDAIFLGEISVDAVESHITTFDLNTRYGLTDRLELGVNLPFVYRTSTYQSIGDDFSTEKNSETSVDEADLGDISLSLSYRLFQETETRPDLVWNLGVRAPTGTDPYGLDVRQDSNTNLNVPTELPTGNGVWGVNTGVSLLKTLDPAIVFANLGYTYNFEESFDDISASEGNQPGDVKLGDTIRAGFGTAFALNENFSLSLSYSHEYIQQSETTQGGATSKVVGSDANVGVLNLGGTYALDDSTSIVTSLGVGLTDDASDVSLTFRMPFQM
ncbi:opacity protein-like surface antigen [Halomonas fontilapidosi]|uniref:Opacity protein-like surface antigen n=1 Tax=Halomonas fontilapidosi TaxID=616675 RepID=A0A7W5DM43_9GAMM|nr:transporter [Halomonas fontilapidosi]MBB3185251.1 opacity protein-like surface antigen [Halomonas fontilapidosi]